MVRLWCVADGGGRYDDDVVAGNFWKVRRSTGDEFGDASHSKQCDRLFEKSTMTNLKYGLDSAFKNNNEQYI